jgi:hypothetical protein
MPTWTLTEILITALCVCGAIQIGTWIGSAFLALLRAWQGNSTQRNGF